MPRIVFTEQVDLQAWLERFGDPLRYTAYATSKNEIILEPMRSTQPLRYAYLKCSSPEGLNRVVARLNEKNYTVLRATEYHWSSDRDVGAKQPMDDLEE